MNGWVDDPNATYILTHQQVRLLLTFAHQCPHAATSSALVMVLGQAQQVIPQAVPVTAGPPPGAEGGDA